MKGNRCIFAGGRSTDRLIPPPTAFMAVDVEAGGGSLDDCLRPVASARIPQSITRAVEVFSMAMIKRLAAAAGLAVAVWAGSVAQAQPPSSAPTGGALDLSGFWSLSFDGRKI